MIHIDAQPEPATFDAKVRQPGNKFLRKFPNPTAKEFSTRCYWREVLDLLHGAYNGVCAYSCHWIPYDTGCDTVEHFLSKKKYPNQAYEWSNYRLVCGTLNGRKADHEDVLDPFVIANGVFVLKFPSLLIVPEPNLRDAMKTRAQQTIVRLGLNDEGTCLKSRIKWVCEYCGDHISFDHLRNHAPFIALELERQGLVVSIKEIMRPQ